MTMNDLVVSGQIWTIVAVVGGAISVIITHIWGAARWKTIMEQQFSQFAAALARITDDQEKMQTKSDERTKRLHVAIDGVNVHLGEQDIKIAGLEAHHEDTQGRFERLEKKVDNLNGKY